MPVASTGDVELLWEERGQGPPLLFVGGTGWDLRRSPTAFDLGLPARFRTVAFDQRGMGRSGKPERQWTMADHADDAARVIEAAGLGRCRVLGFSFGGMVAQELALRHPARVERLLLAGTSAGGPGRSSYPLHQLQDLPAPERARRIVALADTERDAAWEAAHAAAHRALLEQALRGIALAESTPEAVGGARRQLEARRQHDSWERLPALRLPVLVCGGRRDGIAPPRAVAALAVRIPGAELWMFEGGHLDLVQDPRVLAAMADWLARD